MKSIISFHKPVGSPKGAAGAHRRRLTRPRFFEWLEPRALLAGFAYSLTEIDPLSPLTTGVGVSLNEAGDVAFAATQGDGNPSHSTSLVTGSGGPTTPYDRLLCRRV